MTSQHANRPCGNIDDAKPYDSAKDKLYGFKTEASVLPNGIAVHITAHCPGATSDLEVFRRYITRHRDLLRKRGSELDVLDTSRGSDKYPNLWAVLLDKGYYGAFEIVRAIYPTKKPPNHMLSNALLSENHEISSDRIIVENYFGRLFSLCSVIVTKYIWKEEYYNQFMRICAALAKTHIGRNPLRTRDNAFYQTLRNKLYTIGVESAKKDAFYRRNIASVIGPASI